MSISVGIFVWEEYSTAWAGIVAVAILCFTVLPWVMLADTALWKKML